MKPKQNPPNSSLKKETTSSLKKVVPISSKSINDKQKKEGQIKKATNSSTKPIELNTTKKLSQKPKVIVQKPLYKKVQTLKKQELKGKGWGFINFDLLLTISQYYAKDPYDCYFLSKICRVWRMHVTSENGKYFWISLKGGENVLNFFQLKKYLQQKLVQRQQKMSIQFQKNFIKLFNYGSTKQNIANKLIDKLDLEISIQINKMQLKKIPFKLRTFNFSSYLCFKVSQISEFKYDFYTPHNMFKDNLIINISFFSRKYKVYHNMSYKYCPQDVVQMAIKQKAFNYFLDKNLILTFFQGDDNFLYTFFEISALQLVNTFRTNIKKDHKKVLDQKMKKVPLHKKLCQTQFQNFVEYLKFQSDFELHMSYHNSIKQIFTHCNTKVYPIQYDNKHAFFDIDISDSFQKTSTYKLDNKMGMSENIDNLYLLDLVLKDRDRMLIIFSGFIYARAATQNQRQSVQDFFNFSQNQMKILQYKGQKYNFSILVIQQFKKNMIKHVKLNLFP